MSKKSFSLSLSLLYLLSSFTSLPCYPCPTHFSIPLSLFYIFIPLALSLSLSFFSVLLCLNILFHHSLIWYVIFWCCVGSYHRFHTRVFWTMIIIKPLNKMWWHLDTWKSLINSTTYQNFIQFYHVVWLLSWFRKPWYGTCGILLHLTNIERTYILHRYRVASVTTNHKLPPGDYYQRTQ